MFTQIKHKGKGFSLIEVIVSIGFSMIIIGLIIKLQLINAKIAVENKDLNEIIFLMESVKNDIKSNFKIEEVDESFKAPKYINGDKLSFDNLKNNDLKNILDTSEENVNRYFKIYKLSDGILSAEFYNLEEGEGEMYSSEIKYK